MKSKTQKPKPRQLRNSTTQFERWQAKFKPIRNPHDKNASFDGLMFETYGKEYDAVKTVMASNPKLVWTLIDSHKNHHGGYIVAGWHFVDRLGYFICDVPFEDENKERSVCA